MKMIREYEITYIAKEYLMRKGWAIIAYNPPGSQGTFTIPNPEKDPNYRGQTGSESPDIIAIKNKNNTYYILIVECKPYYNEQDVQKMKNLFSSEKRKELFFKIIYKQCLANEIEFDLNKKIKIILGKAHAGEENSVKEMITFLINSKNEKWNPENFNARENIFEYFDVKEINPFGI